MVLVMKANFCHKKKIIVTLNILTFLFLTIQFLFFSELRYTYGQNCEKVIYIMRF